MSLISRVLPPLSTAFLATLVLAGCALHTAESGIAQRDLVPAAAAVLCAHEATAAFPGDVRALCAAQALANGANHVRALLRLVELGTLRYDADAAEACLNAVRNDESARLPSWLAPMVVASHSDWRAPDAVPASCAAVFQGNLSSGARCDDDEQCATGTCAGADRRTCHAPVALGRACDDGQGCISGAVCEDGRCVTCAQSASGGGDCEAPRVAGGRCRAPSDCQSPLNCVAGVCAADIPGVGEPCGRSALGVGALSIAVNACTDGSHCGENHTCQANVQEGERCGAVVRCADDLECLGTCRRPTQEVGQSCDFWATRGCVRGTSCSPVTYTCWPASFPGLYSGPFIPGLMYVTQYPSGDANHAIEVSVIPSSRAPVDGLAHMYSPFRNKFADAVARLLPERVIANWCGVSCAPGSCQPDMQCGAPRIGDSCAGEAVAKTEFATFGCIDGEWHTVGASPAM